MVSYAFLVASTSWKAFCLVQLLLMSNLLQYLMLVPTGSFLDVWVCEYVDVEFLFIFGEPSANRLEKWYF